MKTLNNKYLIKYRNILLNTAKYPLSQFQQVPYFWELLSGVKYNFYIKFHLCNTKIYNNYKLSQYFSLGDKDAENLLDENCK